MLTNDNNDAVNNTVYLEGTISEGRLPEKVWVHKGELKQQDEPMWLPNTSPNIYNYGENFFGCNFQLSFIGFNPHPTVISRLLFSYSWSLGCVSSVP